MSKLRQGIPWAAGLAAAVSILALIPTAAAIMSSDRPPWASKDSVMSAAEMVRNDIDASIVSLRIDVLEARIFNARKEQCGAIKRQDMKLSSTLGAMIQRWRADYALLAKMAYDLRPCEEFGL